MIPGHGERFRSLDDVPVTVWISFAAPGTSTAPGILPRDEVVEIVAAPNAEWVFARPLRHAELEADLVPRTERALPTYGGYVLVVELERLAASFEPLPQPPNA